MLFSSAHQVLSLRKDKTQACFRYAWPKNDVTDEAERSGQLKILVGQKTQPGNSTGLSKLTWLDLGQNYP